MKHRFLHYEKAKIPLYNYEQPGEYLQAFEPTLEKLFKQRGFSIFKNALCNSAR